MFVVIYKCWNDRIKYQIGSAVVGGVIILAWTIYGYVLYFGDDNDCQEHAGTSGWLVVMAIILVLMLILFSILLCCVLPIVLFVGYLQRQNTSGPEGLQDEEIPQVIEKLNRTPYDPNKFTFGNQCESCLMEYEAEDELTQLKCNEKHHFHSDCIVRWISKGKNSCPLCR